MDLTLYQTGQYQAPRRKISKRGSPHLRRTLWTMAAMAIPLLDSPDTIIDAADALGRMGPRAQPVPPQMIVMLASDP